MRQFTDISSAVSNIKLDVEDTVQHILEAKDILLRFSELVCLAQQTDDDRFSDQDAINLEREIENCIKPITQEEWDTGLLIIGDPVYSIKRKFENDEPYDWSYYLQISINGETKTYRLRIFSSLVEQGQVLYSYWMYVDGQPCDIQDFVFEDEVINGYSLCSLATRLNDSLSANEFLSDLCQAVKFPAAYNNVMTKWINEKNLSAEMKNSINTALRNIDGSQQSMLAWLKNLYDSMSHTTVTADNELEFSSTDFMVKNSFQTVGKVLISALGAAVTAIGWVIGKIAMAIGMCLSLLISAVGQAIDNRVNPLITLKSNYDIRNDFLPIPILQRSIASGYGHISSESSANFRITGNLTVTRVFKNAGPTEYTHVEAFLRCIFSAIHFQLLTDRYSGETNTTLGRIISSYGYISENQLVPDTSVDPCGSYVLSNSCNEHSQANLVMAHLALYVMCYSSIHTVPTTNNFSTALQTIKSGTFTEQDVFDVCYWALKIPHTAQTITTVRQWQNYYYGDGSAQDVPYWNWDEVINVMVPAVRAKIPTVFPTDFENQVVLKCARGSFIEANDYIDTTLASSTTDVSTFCSDDIVQQSDSPWCVPKYTGSKLIANLFLSFVTVAATVAVAVISTMALKRLATKMVVQKTTRLATLKRTYDETYNNPQSTKDQVNAAYKKYYKAVKSYNRTSWLWGGGTWSISNGWVDYASDSGSAASIADSMATALNDSAVIIEPNDDAAQITAVTDTRQIATQTADGVEQASRSIDDVITLIAGPEPL